MFVYLGRQNVIHMIKWPFPFCFCMLQAIKSWTVEGLGIGLKYHVAKPMQSLMS